MKEVTDPYHSPSRAVKGMGEASAGAHVGRATERRKRMSVQRAETLTSVEGNTARTALVRCSAA